VSGGEFAIIRELFAPLATEAGAFALTDDVALGPTPEHVVTKDMLIAGVHFLREDPLDSVAKKLIRVNLSDLAAKGAKPLGYLLACAWPTNVRRKDIEDFARGLKEDQQAYKIALWGGDTTRHRDSAAPLTLSATFFGNLRSAIVRRNGASAGDDLYVTGTIGDAGLGLLAAQKSATFPHKDRDFLIGRYRLPEPRLTFGRALPGLASAAIDVSDGLLADAGHLVELAGLKAEIDAAAIPLSAAANRWLAAEPDKNAAYGRLTAFGDDYEILFAAPQSRRRAVAMTAKVSKTPVARIGAFAKGKGVTLKDAGGAAIPFASKGFDHFARG